MRYKLIMFIDKNEEETDDEFYTLEEINEALYIKPIEEIAKKVETSDDVELDLSPEIRQSLSKMQENAIITLSKEILMGKLEKCAAFIE
jgi:hypothetical protein